MSLIVVDTDVASTLLRRRISDALARQLAGRTFAITFVTYGELTKWTVVRRWGPHSLDAMQPFLAALVVLPYNQRGATRWGEIQAYAQLRGRPRPANDSWIAARPELRHCRGHFVMSQDVGDRPNPRVRPSCCSRVSTRSMARPPRAGHRTTQMASSDPHPDGRPAVEPGVGVLRPRRRVRNVIEYRRPGTGGMLCCHADRALPPRR